MLRESNLRTGCAAVSGRAGEPNTQPVPHRQIIAIHLRQSMRVARAGLADDIEGAIAVDVAKTQTVIDRSGRLVFDVPRLVHVGEVAAAPAAQQPQNIAPVPEDVRDAVIVEISHDGKSPRDVTRFTGRLHASEGA